MKKPPSTLEVNYGSILKLSIKFACKPSLFNKQKHTPNRIIIQQLRVTVSRITVSPKTISNFATTHADDALIE